MTFPPFSCSTTYAFSVADAMAVDGPRSWTNQRKRHYASNVEEIAFVSRRPELCASVADAQQLDRNETIWQMDREDRNRKRSQLDCGRKSKRRAAALFPV